MLPAPRCRNPGRVRVVVAAAIPSPQLPERPLQPGFAKKRLLCRRGRRPPLVLQPASVPAPAQRAQHFDRHRRAGVAAALVLPRSRVCSRPEGHDVASGEADVVPEGTHRHGEADDGFTRPHPTVRHGQVKSRARMGARRRRSAIDAEKEGYRDRVPGAVGPVRTGRGLNLVRCRNSREGVRHQDFAALIQDQHAGIGEETEGVVDLGGGCAEMGAEVRARRDRTLVTGPSVQVPP